MLEVTEAAQNEIAAYFKDKEIKPVRVFLNSGGWGGPSLAMALDEPNENDMIIDINEYKFVINKEFMEQAKPIQVDFAGMGFKITSSIDLGSGGCGSDCGSDSGGGDCGSSEGGSCGC